MSEYIDDVFNEQVLKKLDATRSSKAEVDNRLEVLRSTQMLRPTTDSEHLQYKLDVAVRVSWVEYIQSAFANDLFEGPDGNDLLARLRGHDFEGFRSGMAECMACWYLSKHLGLTVEPRPPGKNRRKLDLWV